MTASTETTERRRSPIFIAFLTVLLDLIGFGIVIPVQPFYAEHFGASPAQVTLLGASYSLMQFLFTPLWGSLSDRYGRRPIMLASISLGIAGYVLFALAPGLGVLFLARMLSGFGNANIGTAQSIVADVLPPRERSRGMGMIGAAFGIGFVVGPALGGFLSRFGPSAPPFAAAILGTATLIFAIAKLPETNVQRGAHAGKRSLPGVELFRGLSSPVMGSFLCVTLLAGTAFAMMEQVVGLLIERVWVQGAVVAPADHFSEAAYLTAVYMLLVGIAIAVVQGGLIGRLSKRFSEVALIRTGLAILSVTLLIIPPLSTIGVFSLFCLTGAMLAVGSGIVNPSLSSTVSRLSSEYEQGKMLGSNQAAAALGRVLGPAFAGFLFEFGSGYPFYVGSVLMLSAFLLSLRLTVRFAEQAPAVS